MAITIISQPNLFAPVQNRMVFKVNSSNTSQCGFHYVFDIFTGNTDYISRQRLQARPDGTCNFTPHTVLKGKLGIDLHPTISAVKQARNSGMQYKIAFGEEYGLSNNCTTGTTTFSGLTTQSGYCWNASIGYVEYPTFKYTKFYLTGSTSRFLTERPDKLYTPVGDYETISVLNCNSGGTKAAGFVYTFANNSGTNKLQYFLSNQYSADTAGASKVLNIPAGTLNIESAFATALTYSLYDYFTIQAASGASISTTGISEVRTFKYTPEKCFKYPKVRLAFLNKLGAFEYFNFYGLSRRSISVNKEKYQKFLPFDYTVGQRGTSIVNVDANESVTIGTDYISTEVASWLMKNFYTSPSVYEMQSDGTFLPIIIDSGTNEIKSTFNDKLIDYRFSYTYSFDSETTSEGIGY